jgi:ribonuclease G
MTRQRVRPSLFFSLTEPCSHCGGTGRVFRPETVVRRIERAIRRIAVEGADKEILIRVHPQVALHILEEEPNFLRRLEKGSRLALDLRDDPLMRQDEFRLLSGPAARDVTSKFALG